MTNEDNKILKYHYGEKSLKLPAIICVDLECLLEKMHSCRNNPEKSYTDKKTKKLKNLIGEIAQRGRLFENVL